MLLLYGSANRDERQYGDDAGELDVTPQAAQHPDVQPRRAPLPGRGRGAHAVARRAHRTAGPLPGVRGRRVRNRLGRWQLRAPAAVRPVHGEILMAAATGWPPGAPRWPPTGSSTRRASCSPAQEAATVGMNEIAAAAGCSRATLYRYFENRDALYTAYVHRESYRLYREMTEQIMSVDRSARTTGRGHDGVACAMSAKVRRWHRGSPPRNDPSARRWPSNPRSSRR